jgi:phosphoribosylcarboxyaminoimidazole (NCAIR) mutase
MPKGIPVATVAIGNAENAGLLAVRILATRDPELSDKYASLQCYLHAVFLNVVNVTVCDINCFPEYNSHSYTRLILRM